MNKAMIHQIFAKACRESNLPVKPSKDLDVIYKFAELLIKDATALTLDYVNSQYYDGWLDYRDEIKQHFGIESQVVGAGYVSQTNTAQTIARGLDSLKAGAK